ncbi:MAG: DNA mismatch repair endonuclease MutL [Candidatus Hodarchaeales archaeon]|jgi:DNA mismatch repair protein MutL
MTKLQILDPVVISKIAAGEVIERPASVVKELVENAIDAEATEIAITIVEGGKDLIEIRDNGKGLASDELPLAIQRHSTSKIVSEEDLARINTMGFRGEALYSIASVCRFTMISRRAEEEIATKLIVSGDVDNTTLTEDILATPGTIIRVKDLFFNFIVRRKFLKKSYIEQGHIYNIVAQYAVAHPGISFILTADGKELIHTLNSSDYLQPIRKVFGSELANGLLNLGVVRRGTISAMGYISKPGSHKRNRKFQFFYLNGRRIFSKIIQEALEEGFGGYLMKGEFPCVFLFLDIDPEDFDVNIHPQKREVLFYDEKTLRIAVHSAINHCLKTSDLAPQLSSSPLKNRQTKLDLPTPNTTSSRHTITGGRVHLETKSLPSEINFRAQSVQDRESSNIIKKDEILNLIGADLKFRGPLGKEFMLLEDILTNDLVILDFHAAHERVNLEQFINLNELGKVSIQTLLQPYELNKRSVDEQLIPQLSNLGFDIRIPKYRDDTIEIHGIPKILAKTDIKAFFELLSSKIDTSLFQDEITKILSVIACHSSYRSGDQLSFRQTQELLSQLAKTENPNICAHGRPTYFRITHQEMLKQARRI